MSPVSARYILEHGPMLRALGAAALGALRGPRTSAPPPTPGAWHETEVKAPSPALVRAFVAMTGGDPAAYRGVLPPHLFPQWTLAAAARAIADVPYPLARIVNAGCTLDVRAPIPAGEALVVRARLAAIDATESRVLLTTRIETGTRAAPDALVAELRTLVPRAAARPTGATPPARTPAEPPRVADDARELARVALGRDAGLDFAKLTGDFNPIHWSAAYARANGFRGCVLHGFGTFAFATSALVHGRFSGDHTRLRRLDARFTRPLRVPARVGTYVTDAGELFVGDAPGGTAYLVGRYEIGPTP